VKALRIIAIIGAIALMIGELYRSWGVGRPIPFVIDDLVVGAMMISAGVLVGHQTIATRAYFSAAWGVSAGMLYGSFFSKLYDPGNAVPGNMPLGLLILLLGLAFALSVLGLIASVLLPMATPGQGRP
jgi:hypothetical protein